MATEVNTESQPKKRYYNLIESADLILENDGEYVYIFLDKLWALSVEVQENYRHVTMVSFPDKDELEEFVTEQILDFGYVVKGGAMRDQIVIDFND